MNKPRNPRYFPNMKVRGARRRRLAPYQRLSGAFDTLASGLELTTWQMHTFKAEWRDYKPRHVLGAEHAPIVHQFQPPASKPAVTYEDKYPSSKRSTGGQND